MIKRQAVQNIEAQKIQMVAALYANSSFSKYEEGNKDRAEQIKTWEQYFVKACEAVYHPELAKQDEDANEPDWNDPFWQAQQRNYKKTLERIEGIKPDATVQQVVDEMSPEQKKARQDSRRDIDQMR